MLTNFVEELNITSCHILANLVDSRQGVLRLEGYGKNKHRLRHDDEVTCATRCLEKEIG